MLATLDYAKPLQVEDELAAFVGALRRLRVRSYLEIGTRYGGSFEAVMSALPLSSTGVAVDFPGGGFGDSESAPILFATLARLRARGQDVDCILGPSAAPEVVARAAQAAPFDAIFIDADHSYEAVKRDFQLYAPMAAKAVILHDIAAPPGHTSTRGLPVEVPVFWEEIRPRYRHLEIVAPGSVMGLGILFLERT
jgi:predicted O-methyltransferase YrrM